MNRFTYGNYTFDDSVIVSADIATEQSLLSEHLSADTLTLVIRSDDVGNQKVYTVLMEWYTTVNDEGYVVGSSNLADFTYGTPILYYRDNVLYGKFYVTQVIRVGDGMFQITAVSAIGMMAYMTHKGGVYTNVQARTIIQDIMSGTGFAYSIQSALGNTVVNGLLPYANKMSNLQQLLFAIGGALMKDAGGDLSFVFNSPTTTKTIGSDRIKEGSGDNVFLPPATRIALTEHTFYQNPNSVSEEIYRASSNVTNATIVLNEPVVASTITGDSGITFVEKNATCITFSGIGTIYAIKYTHLTSEVTWNATTVNGEENEVTIGNATLVTGLNSANVMSRLVKYYSQRQQTNLDFYVNTEKSGDYVSFDDRFGDEKDGFVSKLTISLSKEIGGKAEVTTNWYPSEQGNNFNAYQLIQSTGTVTVPTAARGKAGRLVLIGGFRGGQGGTAGEDGEPAIKDDQPTGSGNNRFYIIHGGEGGTEGGKGGAGGVGCMVYTVDIASLPSSFSVTAIGAGGAGGAAGAFQGTGLMGALGGNTTVTISGSSYSSASGTENTSGFINFIDGTYYNYQGSNGFDNDTGVGGSGAAHTAGGSFTANGTTWAGGAKGRVQNGSGYNNAQPSGGGGAAYGSVGYQGGLGRTDDLFPYTGDGGQGATPITPAQASFPYGGNGGHGGGCGGGGGSGSQYYGASNVRAGSGGSGGAGSAGGQGANGAVIFYYGT